jgi:hypothetical protein
VLADTVRTHGWTLIPELGTKIGASGSIPTALCAELVGVDVGLQKCARGRAWS